jgi:peroxiredoxin
MVGPNVQDLPPDLPVPEDDGAAAHLPGMRLPPVRLASTDGERVDLSTLAGTTVVYCYPMTGRPDRELPAGWDGIPGARGCTPQSCSFARVFGVSTQSTGYQREAVERLHLPYALLSDEGLAFAEAVGLPTFQVDAQVLTKRLTMILQDGVVEKVFYPVFPPNEDAPRVLGWLSGRTQR